MRRTFPDRDVEGEHQGRCEGLLSQVVENQVEAEVEEKLDGEKRSLSPSGAAAEGARIRRRRRELIPHLLISKLSPLLD